MLLFFNTVHLCENYSHIEEIEMLNLHRRIISSNNSMFYDRSETVVSPVKVENKFKIPNLNSSFDLSYEEVCNITAKNFLDTGKKLRVMWSGGIDSTLILVSLFKLGITDQLEIALNIDSISENQEFYYNHILGKFKIIPSTDIKSLFSKDHILIGGEYNDQLLGSNLLPLFSKYYDTDELFKKLSRDKIYKIFSSKLENKKIVDRWIDIYLKTIQGSPVPIETNLDFHWWINFCCKWQGLYFRLASYTDLKTDLDNYHHFFQNDLFQQWALINHNQKFYDWKDYKRICKEIIYRYDKNKNYLDNKIKSESLTFMAQKNSFYNFIDSDQRRYFDLPENCFQESQDFKLP